ncbi:hypothetical protein PAXRUDRAFT_671763 [Paxillus rubicundulus Ve08.2h10]|uniref:Uncharacterized protein n=1 Tax=Paxillus rubicundulus Ve08.2h10 TaxID=930991 RepID=A0A0D0E8I6_9AGAM|nr:hypothetical protein PAXRUDRAFT_671763 [Paxillus rubicundulus Ve08.2h10]
MGLDEIAKHCKALHYNALQQHCARENLSYINFYDAMSRLPPRIDDQQSVARFCFQSSSIARLIRSSAKLPICPGIVFSQTIGGTTMYPCAPSSLCLIHYSVVRVDSLYTSGDREI